MVSTRVNGALGVALVVAAGITTFAVAAAGSDGTSPLVVQNAEGDGPNRTYVPQTAVKAPKTAGLANVRGIQLNASQTFYGFVACQEKIVEGDVVALERAGKRLLVTLGVTRWFIPDTGPARVTLDVKDPVVENPAFGIPFEIGVHYLIAVPKPEAGDDLGPWPPILDTRFGYAATESVAAWRVFS